jgi:RNA polymerase sigma-70 factor (ECF subfamily)
VDEVLGSKERHPIWLDETQESGLVQMAKQGNREAFLTLVSHYERPLYRLAFALVRERHEASVLAREAFERAWAGMRTLPEGKRFFPWVLRFARNLCVTHSRRNAGAPARHAGEAPRPPDPGDDAAFSALRDSLRDLRPDEQMALALRVVERLPHHDIAALLDQPVWITLARLSTARGFLLDRKLPPGEAAGLNPDEGPAPETAP